MNESLFEKASMTFQEWSTENCVPVLSLDPTSAETEDLKLIGKSIGNARFVALSEGFHNCKEMMSLHHRIICYLIEECGFNIVLSESGYPESLFINDYIQGKCIPEGIDLWKSGLNKMYSAWKEGQALIEYLKQYNSDHGNAIEYYGVDIGGFYQDWVTPFNTIFKYIKNVDEVYCKEFELKLQPYLDQMSTNARKNYADNFSVIQKATLCAILDEAVIHFVSKADDFTSKSSKKEYERIRQSLISMQLAENYYRNYDAVTKKYVGLNGREIAMAQNCLWVYQRSDAKIIWIDHVIHTKTKSQLQDGIWGNFTPTGQLIKQALGKEYYGIGMVYGSGAFWNKWQRPAERFIDKIPEWDEKRISFEKEVSLGIPASGNYFIDFSAAPKNFELQYWLATPLSLRENDYYMQIEPQEWDSCIFLETASPATPV